jgi:hypothetical protein
MNDLLILYEGIMRARQAVWDYDREAIRQHNMPRCTFCREEADFICILGRTCESCVKTRNLLKWHRNEVGQ